MALADLLELWLELGELAQAQAGLSRVRQLVAGLDDPDSWRERTRRLEAIVLLHQGEWFQAVPLLRLCQAEAREQGNPQGLHEAERL